MKQFLLLQIFLSVLMMISIMDALHAIYTHSFNSFPSYFPLHFPLSFFLSIFLSFFHSFYLSVILSSILSFFHFSSLSYFHSFFSVTWSFFLFLQYSSLDLFLYFSSSLLLSCRKKKPTATLLCRLSFYQCRVKIRVFIQNSVVTLFEP